jgi:hypothetical protein
LTGKGDMRVAYIDPNTHELVKDTIAKVSKRGSKDVHSLTTFEKALVGDSSNS